MTSVVDTSVKLFTSQMVAAPVLNGVIGSKIAQYDACLVNGFDLKSVTSLVVSAGVATLSFAGTHSAIKDSVVLVAGSSIAALNGEQKVTSIGSGVVRFATAAADGTATGTITFKMAPAGWEKVFTGTNKAVYRSADPASTRHYLRIDDTAATLCRVVGYETMTDVDTGTGPFPTAAQQAGGGYWPKSSAANANANAWVLVIDGRAIIDSVAPAYGSGAAYLNCMTRFFGDGIAAKPSGDPYFCLLNYSSVTSPTQMYDSDLDGGSALQSAAPRGYTGLGSAVRHVLLPYTGSPSLFSGMDTTLGPFPSEIDGKLKLSRKYAADSTVKPPRGDIPGWYHCPQSLVFDTIKLFDTVVVGARTLMAVNGCSHSNIASTSFAGAGFIDITGPWR